MPSMPSNTLNRVVVLAVATLVLSAAAPAPAQTPPPSTPPVSTLKAPAVLVCGTGMSPHYETIVDGLMDFLGENKIAAKTSEGHSFDRTTCVAKSKEAGASALLYVSTSVSETNSHATTYSIQCFSADGSKLWEEEVRGPLMSGSVSSTLKTITSKMNKALKPHLGQPGLAQRTS